ncbi:unnamed protein product (macronuclear) [Paramecium tetraurelia]|uniref:Uncharacterized protein n=1 Tax=Paramecium tetraurelia TaxID=5888 RepID=A0E0Z6_PARTE|nr:uncharacterized protein GSPATT00022132001 [Paramecium tetraurelia]CAK88963.1 unnamed protein product [Paramecium tetraurelia]|eukprot:XP_001456360.1 hypothetical protein (macronuclear) [Paramecium tetraurelia strain d4-2]
MHTMTQLCINFNYIELSGFSFFSPRNIRDNQNLILKTSTTPHSKQRKIVFPKKKKQKSKSLPPSCRIPQMEDDQQFTTLTLIERLKKRYFQPLKNAVAKITEIRQQQQSRRKSTYGLMFGQLTSKEMLNLPTVIEQHKQVNKQELAIASFAIMLERKQRKKTTRKLSKKLSKQESLIGIIQLLLFKEYDNMERPPSCKTPPKLILTSKPKVKSKLQLEKERYFKGLDLKMCHFLSSKLQQNVLPQEKSRVKTHFQTKSCVSLQNLQICSFISSPKLKPAVKLTTEINLVLQKQKSKSTLKTERPYIKHNTQLLKKIQQTFETRNTTWSRQNSLEQKQY